MSGSLLDISGSGVISLDFTRKARYVAGGHMTDPPATLTYSSVVSRDSVCIGFLIAALNELELLAADVGNAYLNAPTRERIHNSRTGVWRSVTRKARVNCSRPVWFEVKRSCMACAFCTNLT